jgi:hypothetical protein
MARSYCQDPQFSQFYSNPLYLAPLLQELWKVAVLPWYFEISGGRWIIPQGYTASPTIIILPLLTWGGISRLQDVAGTSQLGSLNLGLQYSYNFKIFNLVHIRPGLAFY